MKKENIALYVLRLAATLLIITTLVAAALAGVNHVTAPIIAQAKEAKTQEAITNVLEGGGEPIDFTGADKTGLVTAVYKGENGYAVQVRPAGFGGAIDMMVGISNEGKVVKITIISHAETPSLGAVAAADGSAGENFRDSFVGLSGEVKVSKEGGEADTISGATITSKAVAAGVNAALDCVENMG